LDKKHKILVTGSGCPGWYSVYQSLNVYKPLSLIGCDIHPNTSGALLADKHYVVSKGDDSRYLIDIKKLVEEEEIDCIIPLTDPELIPLSLLETSVGCSVMTSSSESLSIMLDKGKLYKTIPEVAPIFSYTSDISTREFIVNHSVGSSCYIKLPSGYGSRGTKKIVPEYIWLDGFVDKKPEAFGSTFPISFVDRLHIDNLLLIETLPGNEYSIDCVFCRRGYLKFYGVREREATKNGICHTAKFVVDSSYEFRHFIDSISNKIPMKYNINIQARRDKHGKLKLLEINPRISGSVGSFAAAGFNLPAMGLDFLLTDGQHHNPLITLITPSSYSTARAFRISHFIS
jgi:carbamoylphosphate synthase large subunit